jgi:CBS domain-containing protein
MQAKEVMTEGVMSIAGDATVLQAAELLVNTRVSAMPVLDGAGTMIGIVSLTDLLGGGHGSVLGWLREFAADERAAASLGYIRTVPVTDVMTPNVVVVADDASLLDVAELMHIRKVKHVPVVRDGGVVGMVSRIDILKAVISHAAGDTPRSPLLPAAEPADAQLRDAIIAAMGTAPNLPIHRADVVVLAGVAHLWGVAPNEDIRRACDALVQKVPGVKVVMNHMHVPAAYR